MNMADINKLFTDAVKEYLDKGFVVNGNTMSGMSSYEVCKVDLTDGVDIYRILLEDTHELIDKDDFDFYLSLDGLRLSIRRYPGKKPHSRISWGLSHYESDLVMAQEFYAMPDRSNHRSHKETWYTKDFDAIVNAERVHRRRSRNRLFIDEFYSCDYPDSMKKNLLPLVRRFPRCKTAHLEDIGRVWRRKYMGRNEYHFDVRGKSYVIALQMGERG